MRDKKKQSESSNSLGGKLPPQAVEIEGAVLGAMIIESNCIESVLAILVAENFYKEAHQRIFTAIISLKNSFEPVDLLTLVNELRKSGTLELIGGASYLVGLTNKVNNSANVEMHARIVQQLAIKRELISNASEILTSSYDDTTDTFDVLSNAIEGISKISQSIFRNSQKTNASIMKNTIEVLGNSKKTREISCGLSFLDSRMKLRHGQNKLVYIGARPSVGKSALITAMMKNIAKSGVPVGCFSLEMSAEDITNRMIVSELQGIYTNDSFVPEEVQSENIEQVQRAIAKVKDLPIFYNDNPKSMEEICSTAQLWYSKHNVEVIFVDFIQKIPTEYKEVMRAVTYCSDKLQKLSKTLNTPIICISSLNREAEKRNGRPSIADFRGSGDIESDADVVLMLWRPEDNDLEQIELKIDGKNESISTRKLMVGDFAKNRNGKKDIIVWYHDLPTNNFYEHLEQSSQMNYPSFNNFPTDVPKEFKF